MPIEYTTTAQMPLSDGVKIVIYANSGMGKTMLAATAPAPLLISAESGLLSLQKKNIERVYGINTPGITYDIPTAIIRNVNDLMEVYSMLLNPQHSANFKTIYLDSLSEIAEVVLAHAVESNNDGRMAYKDMADQIIDMCKKFRDLPGKHVVFSCKEGYCEDSRLNGPSLPGKILSHKIPYLFDEVLQIAIYQAPNEPPVRFLRTQPDIKNDAKDRSGSLSYAGEQMNLTNIFDKIAK